MLLLGWHGAATAGDVPAMILPGQFNVSATGAFTYSIPIAVPPGTAGMVPALSLDYSSQNGDGLEGMGWVLSGIPSITRCPSTLATDKVHGSVNYDSRDKFCFEGQRLILNGGGNYGGDGTTYRTEVDGFSEFIAHGQLGGGPAWFEVHTKAGQIMDFGTYGNSQVLAVGKSVVRAWALYQVSDTAGNYLTVTYNTSPSDCVYNAQVTYGLVCPSEIDYTGNSKTGMATYNAVKFFYESRPYSTPAFQAGSLQQNTALLTDIKTYGPSLTHDYKINYNLPTNGAQVPTISTVSLCDSGGVCLNPTSFTWQGTQDAPPMSSHHIATTSAASPRPSRRTIRRYSRSLTV